MRGKPSHWLIFTLIATTLLALLAAGPVWYFNHQAEQRRWVHWLDDKDTFYLTEPFGPEWLNKGLQSFGFDPLIQVIEIRYCPSGLIGDRELSQMMRLWPLRVLNLSGLPITDDGLACLESKAELIELRLCHTRITDAGLTHLSHLKRLGTLDLSETAVTDAGLEDVYILLLSNTRISVAGLARMGSWTKLNTLDLSKTSVTDADLTYLTPLGELIDLQLRQTKITDAGLAHLSRLKHLQYLDLSDTQITDAGLAYLLDSPNLEQVVLGDSPVTDEGMSRLKKQFEARGRKVVVIRTMML